MKKTGYNVNNMTLILTQKTAFLKTHAQGH